MSCFISYVRENSKLVDNLCEYLESHNIEVWIDRKDLAPGSRWKQEIRAAIRNGSFFIACFSKEYNESEKTYMNEELTLAIEEIRIRPINKTWFIPVKLNECKIPDRDIGGGETLGGFTYTVLYENWDKNVKRIVEEIQRGMPKPPDQDTDQRPDIDRAQEEFDNGLGSQNRADKATDPEEKRRGYQEAVRYYTEAIGFQKDFAEAYYNRAIAYNAIGNHAKAIEDLTSAITLQYNLPDAHYSRGLAYFKRDDLDEAVDDLTKAIQLQPDFTDAYYARSKAWLLLDEWENAMADLAAYRSMQS